MTAHAYRLVNVFTRDGAALSGNPLCVFEDGAPFDERTMQALARQFNLSETTFILPSSRASARVRIFTPAYEMPFAGHDANAHRWREIDERREAIAAMLALEIGEIAERPLWVSTGREQLIIPLTSTEAVIRARPQPDRLTELRSGEGASMAYIFASRGTGSSPSGGAARPELLLARFFFPQGPAVLEDPATGSATANLGGWCLALGRELPCRFEIEQGEQTGRPSLLYLEVGEERGIRVSGDVVELGRGTINLGT